MPATARHADFDRLLLNEPLQLCDAVALPSRRWN